MKIELIPYIGYCFAFMGQRTAFSDYFAKEAADHGMLICAKLDDKFAGYICAAGNGRENRVSYAYTRPEYRGQGIFTSLLKEISDGSEMPVKINLPAEHECHGTVVHVCDKLGFVRGEDLTVYTYRPELDTLWEGYMNERGNRICEHLKRHGYETVSFADADDGIIAQIRGSDSSGFENPFETASFFDEPSRKLSRELSFAAVKNCELAAYTLVSQPSPEKCVLEQIAVSRNKRGTGVILLPAVQSMSVFRSAGYKNFVYAIYGSNTPANLLRDKLISTAEKKVTENYYHLNYGKDRS
ncbi:MAG: GNAT family N-acetyltransferase [Ruminiclostridium sp.]|nr:GNAT family N-acetyltransferase [Ruminiclostridium sp.]